MKRRGFTIIELIIVVTIMGILLTIGVVNLRGSQANGRDAERKVDVDTIALHLETYYTSGVDSSVLSSDCTGGTITHNGGYTVHAFTVSGTLTCSSSLNANILVVGGGGGGGGGSYGGGGGGGGGYLAGSQVLSGSMGVTVGVGGTAGAAGSGSDPYLSGGLGGNGGDSVFGSYTVKGGGGGASVIYAAVAGQGSGGGGASADASHTSMRVGATGTTGQGHAGGYGSSSSSDYAGGGGGAGGNGASGSNAVGGNGGGGTNLDIVQAGTDVGYAGGGGGGVYSGTRGTGSYGGGNGAIATSTGSTDPTAGAASTGGGGGGGAALPALYRAGGAGGSGVVIIRYLTPGTTAAHTTTYPSTALTATTASMIQALRDIDTKSITAPGITDPTLTFISATNNVQTTADVLPQPTKDQYIYQPIHSDGSLCNDAAECRKFNLYYKLENATTDCPAPNNICMITSRNQ